MRNQNRSSINKGGWLGTLQAMFSSSWAFIIFASIGVLVALFVTITVTLYLAYGFSNDPPESLSIESVQTGATIEWHKNQTAHIEAENLESAFMALGALHATAYPWQLQLWRQTALGSLTEWFGPNLFHIDRLTKRLRLSPLAQDTYRQLPAYQTRLLDAYTEGINSALAANKQIKQNELTLLDVEPDPWLPWHTLAVERLFAWLSLDLHSITVDSTGTQLPEWTNILEDNRALKKWLQVHGFHNSMAGAWPVDAQGTQTIFHRLVYGSSAIPFMQEVTLTIGNRPMTRVASIPGTFIFPSGQSPSNSWFILPYTTGELNLQPASLEPTTIYERIQSADGGEALLTFDYYPGWLLPHEEQTPLDSLPGLQWKGFYLGTDLPGYLSLLENTPPSFSLLDGHGLITEADEWQVLGTPPYIHSLTEGVLIGGSPWSTYQASRLNTLLENPTDASPDKWPEDCHNDWAEKQATFLLEEYLLRRISFEDEYSDALTYLRNWDYAYTPSSIGAIIFDTWIQELPDSLYQKVISKELTPTDTLARMYLQEGIASLRESFGTDLSKWRLDLTKPIYRYYPAWNADSLFAPRSFNVSEDLYAPLSFPGRGHAATLCWGSFLSREELEISTRWDSWSTSKNGQFVYQWRKHDDTDSFLGRYLISNTPSSSYTSEEDYEVIATTRINYDK